MDASRDVATLRQGFGCWLASTKNDFRRLRPLVGGSFVIIKSVSSICCKEAQRRNRRPKVLGVGVAGRQWHVIPSRLDTPFAEPDAVACRERCPSNPSLSSCAFDGMGRFIQRRVSEPTNLVSGRSLASAVFPNSQSRSTKKVQRAEACL